MKHGLWAAGAAIAIVSLGCDLEGSRPPAPTPSPSPTPEQGLQWEMVGQTGFDVGALQFVDAQRAWAVGADGNHIARSEDGGRTWAAPRALPSGLGNLESYRSVSFIDPRHGWVGGESGVYKTEDGGDTWAPVAPFQREHRVGRTNDDPIPGFMRFRDYEHGVVEWDGQINVTMDGGATWAKAPITGGLRKVGVIGAALAVLTDAALWKALPDGTWEEILLPEDLPRRGVTDFFFLDDRNGWLGASYRTADGGKKWFKAATDGPSGRTARLGGWVRFVDAARGFGPGSRSFAATRNGGILWTDAPMWLMSGGATEHVLDVQIVDPANVYGYTSLGKVWRCANP